MIFSNDQVCVITKHKDELASPHMALWNGHVDASMRYIMLPKWQTSKRAGKHENDRTRVYFSCPVVVLALDVNILHKR
jgi:hypothetical protein